MRTTRDLLKDKHVIGPVIFLLGLIVMMVLFTFWVSYTLIPMCCEGHNFVAMLESQEGELIRFERPGCKICCCAHRFNIENTKPTCRSATSDYDSKCKCNFSCYVF